MTFRPLRIVAAVLCASALAACAQSAATLVPQTSLRDALAQDLQGYLSQPGPSEHISAVSLSVSLHGASSPLEVTAGTTTFGGTTPVTAGNLFQIGSNTKAFTAVIILQLEAEGRLTINQTVGQWLPQYPTWAPVTIRQLLNMTSGIKTYDDTSAWATDYAAAPTSFFSAPKLISYIDPAAPLQQGWLYSNTGYELTQLIIEKVTGNAYATEIQNRVIGPLGLRNTYYDAHIYSASVQSQMSAGYFDNRGPGTEPMASILDRDVRPFTASWAQAAGAVVSNPSDLIRFVRALYQGSLLAQAQRTELMSMVSQATGLPIADVSSSETHGFGLGVGRLYQPALGGAAWYYEGETLGYRMLYVYLPPPDTVIAIGLNSQPTEDHIGQLVTTVFQTLKSYNEL